MCKTVVKEIVENGPRYVQANLVGALQVGSIRAALPEKYSTKKQKKN